MKSLDEILLSETTDIKFKESLELTKPKSWLKLRKCLSFDAMTSRVKFTDVSFTLFEATFRQKTRTAIDKSSDYLSFGLVDEDGILTNAGVLLSDQCPVYQSRIFCTRWNGLDKGSIFEDAIDDKEYNGNIISLLENGVAFVKNNSKVKWEKTLS